jgi:hypothetical protein
MGDGSAPVGPEADLTGVTVPGPTGPGWVVELYGYHFHNDPKDRDNYGPLHVQNTLLKQLKDGEVDVPMGPGQPPGRFTMKELGIGYAILAHSARPRKQWMRNPNFAPVAASSLPGGPAVPAAGLGMIGGAPGAGAPGTVGPDGNMLVEDPNNPQAYQVIVYDFAVQFVWQEKPLLVRLQERKVAEEAAKAAAEAAAAAAAAPPGEGGGPAAAPPAPPGGAPAVPPAAAAAGGVPANDPGLLPPEEVSGPPGIPPAAGVPAAAPPPAPGANVPPAGAVAPAAPGAAVPPNPAAP